MKRTRIEIHFDGCGLGFTVKSLTNDEAFALQTAIKAVCKAMEASK